MHDPVAQTPELAVADPDGAAAASPSAPAFSFETGTMTHPGLVRRQNEDNFLARPDLGLWAVADGLGGHEDGALASRTVVDELGSVGQAVSAADFLARVEQRLMRANDALREVADSRGVVIGSTVVAVLIRDRHYACAWSGDSRIYRVRGGSISQLTRDHTEAQDLVDRGVLDADEAKVWPRRHVITRAIGIADEPEIDLAQGPIEEQDAFVLCSDGLTGYVEDGEIAATVAAMRPEAACRTLVDLTLSRGAADNVTVVVLRVGPPAADGDRPVQAAVGEAPGPA